MQELIELIETQNQKNTLKKPKPSKFLLLVMNVVMISSFICFGYGIKALKENEEMQQESQNLEAKLQQMVKEETKKEDEKNEQTPHEEHQPVVEEKKYENSYQMLKNINSDTIGYLEISGTKVSLPIVQAKNNQYYLNHDFEKNYNSMGWAYADYRNHFPNLDQNTIIYGHTYKNTTIFSSLQNLLTSSWYRNQTNHILDFSIQNEHTKWQVFSVYTIDKTSDYLYTHFTEKEWQTFIQTITKRSKYKFPVTVSKDDVILTLSTCYITDEQRLVVHAKKIH